MKFESRPSSTKAEEIIVLQSLGQEKAERSADAMRRELERTEADIVSLEQAPQTAQLDLSIQKLREQADFMRQMLESAEKTADVSREYQAEQLKRIEGTRH